MQVTCRFGQRREHNVDNESYMHILSHIEFENRLRKSTQIRQEALDSKKIESTLLWLNDINILWLLWRMVRLLCHQTERAEQGRQLQEWFDALNQTEVAVADLLNKFEF